MKNSIKPLARTAGIIVIILAVIYFLVDFIILPFYVSAPELKVPNVVGMNKDAALKILGDAGLKPVIQTSRFDERFAKDQVIYQKPNASTVVKENRRIYLTVSGGDPLVRMPSLINKTIRDAQLTLDRLGLEIGSIDSVESEAAPYTIIEQEYLEGKTLTKGTKIDIKLSVGPKIGMVRVPNILGKSLSDAEAVLKSISLRIGSRIYEYRQSWLPNTIIDQSPSEGTLLQLGDSVSVVISQTQKPE